MNIIDDMKNLTEQQRLLITRFTNRLLKQLPTAHTITLTRRPGLKRASLLTDYEVIVFVNEVSGVSEHVRNHKNDGARSHVSESGNSKSSVSKIYAAATETYPICNPGLDYIHSARLIYEEEAEALSYGFKEVFEETRQSYFECLKKHLMFFVKRESMNVITVNSREMQKGKNLKYYRYYMIFHSKTGYVLYNRDVQPTVTLHTRL